MLSLLQRMVLAFVKNGCKEEVEIVQRSILRTKEHKIVTRNTKKNYRVVYDKRRVLDDFTTVPYGYYDA